MPAPSPEIEIVPPDSADALWCIDQYFRDLSARVRDGFDRSQTSQISDDEITPPNGLFVIARIDGRAIGCGALKLRDGITGEVKRMWVHADARGRGVGRAILQELERLARECGLHALRLDTNRNLKDALTLYRRCGFIDVSPFNTEPYAHHWLQKSLASD